MGQESKMDMQAMMQEYEKLAVPGEAHKLLTRQEGHWEIRMKGWMEPDQPPMESTGNAEFRMILGGRFLEEEIQSEMMGRPYNGKGLMGYDNFTQRYTTVWIDDMGTAVMVFEGSPGSDGRTITQTSHYDDPVQGPMDFRTVTTFIDDNTLGFEMYSTVKGKQEQKMMEIVYTRKS